MRPLRRGLGLTSSDLIDLEWRTIEPLLPTARGIKRVDDRRVLNGILWRLRTGRSWASIPERYGRSATCHARFVRWRDAGVWCRIVHAVSDVRSGQVELIDAATACVPPCYRRTVVANDAVAWRTGA
jgi:transposase